MDQEYIRTDVDRTKDLYAIICNGELGDGASATATRVGIIEELERLTCSDFKDTADFHRKVGSFIMRESSGGDRLKRFRKSKGWSQEALATHLGISQRLVSQMENGILPLLEQANDLICSKSIQSSTEASTNASTGLSAPKNGVVGAILKED